MTAAFQLNAFQPNAFQVLVITGVLYATDQDDTGAFVGTVSGGEVTVDMHDGGFKHKELKHIEETKKRLGPSCMIVLLAAPKANTYYERLGFEHNPRAWTIKNNSI